MMIGLFYAEWSGPFFIVRCAWKRQQLEHTFKFHLMVWIYSTIYFISRGAMFSYYIYPITLAMNIPYYMKVVFTSVIFLSYGWMVLISSYLWKTIPNWFSDPKKIERTYWWRRGRELYKKYCKDKPMVYVTAFGIIVVVVIMPLSAGYYCHYVDDSWGYYGDDFWMY
jgi:hypothetical protein